MYYSSTFGGLVAFGAKRAFFTILDSAPKLYYPIQVSFFITIHRFSQKRSQGLSLEGWYLEILHILYKIDPLSLSHWGRVTHMCVSKLTIIGSDNGLSPGRRQAIIWTNAGILLIGPLGAKFSEILIEILRVSFKKMRLKGSSAKWRPFCLGLNALLHKWLSKNEGYGKLLASFWSKDNVGFFFDKKIIETIYVVTSVLNSFEVYVCGQSWSGGKSQFKFNCMSSDCQES